MAFPILIAFALLITSSYTNAMECDYCVADLAGPRGSFGYLCKDPTQVKTDDFSYSGLRAPANTSNAFKFGVSYALTEQFPALNGMGLSMVRADIDVGGSVPLHSHRVAEMAIVIKGTMIAGFIDTNNTAIYKTLNAGDVFLFPPALAHFQVNVGNVSAVGYAAFASSSPGFQTISTSLFKNDLPTDVVQKITLLDPAQIQKLKHAFGGTI